MKIFLSPDCALRFGGDVTMLLDVAQRRVIKIAVTGKGKEALEKVSERYGMKEFIVGGKVYEWFVRQDDIFQRAVLGLLHGIEMDAAKAFMERLVKGEPGPLPAGEEDAEVKSKPARAKVMVADPGAKPTRPPQTRETRPGEHSGRQNAQ